MEGTRSQTAILAILAVVAGGCSVGCRCGDERASARRPVSGAAASASSIVVTTPPSPVLPPLAAAADLVELPVSGHRPVTVSVPRGATRPRPLVLVLHGGRDRPEDQCRTWRRIAGGELFIVCPRGLPSERPSSNGSPTFHFAEAADAERQLRGALRALKAEFGAHVAGGSVVLVGVDTSATLALAVARTEPAFFSHLILIEGGFEYWTPSLAARYSVRGGRRTLFACLTSSCQQRLESAVALAGHVGLESRGVTADGPGTVHDGPLLARLAAEFPWLVDNDSRFQSTTAARTARSVAPAASSGSASSAGALEVAAP